MSNADLIAEARRWTTPAVRAHVSHELLDTLDALATALESQPAPVSNGQVINGVVIPSGFAGGSGSAGGRASVGKVGVVYPAQPESQPAPLVAESREALAREIAHWMPGVAQDPDDWNAMMGGRIADALLASGVVSLAADRDWAVAERAWDEGWLQGFRDCDAEQERADNPYRESEARNEQ